jgi:hypothetical protein
LTAMATHNGARESDRPPTLDWRVSGLGLRRSLEAELGRVR